MRIRGLGAARRLADRVRTRFRPGPLILGYHRIADSPSDPQELCVSPDHFAEHLEVLRKLTRPTTLGGVARALRDKEVDGRSFVVTFDDGYPDTRHAALPIIQRYEIPVTVFVISGLLDGSFWWLELKAMIEHCRRLPEEITLEGTDGLFQWRNGPYPGDRCARLLRKLENLFRSEAPSHHGRLLEQLRAMFGTPDCSPAAVRSMTTNELAELAASELVEIGSHTTTHTPLDRLDADHQTQELRQSKETLEAVSGRRVRAFSFPNGAVSRATPGIARQLGYEAGCCSRASFVSRNCDPMMLPRVWPGDWNGDRFSRWVRCWL